MRIHRCGLFSIVRLLVIIIRRSLYSLNSSWSRFITIATGRGPRPRSRSSIIVRCIIIIVTFIVPSSLFSSSVFNPSLFFYNFFSHVHHQHHPHYNSSNYLHCRCRCRNLILPHHNQLLMCSPGEFAFVV